MAGVPPSSFGTKRVGVELEETIVTANHTGSIRQRAIPEGRFGPPAILRTKEAVSDPAIPRSKEVVLDSTILRTKEAALDPAIKRPKEVVLDLTIAEQVESLNPGKVSKKRGKVRDGTFS